MERTTGSWVKMPFRNSWFEQEIRILQVYAISVDHAPSTRTRQREKKKHDQLRLAATDCRPLDAGWLKGPQTPAASKREPTPEDTAIRDLEKKLRSKRNGLTGHNLTRHEAVLAFLYYQNKTTEKETRENMSLVVARCFGKGVYFARKVVTWERQWKENRSIETRKDPQE